MNKVNRLLSYRVRNVCDGERRVRIGRSESGECRCRISSELSFLFVFLPIASSTYLLPTSSTAANTSFDIAMDL